MFTYVKLIIACFDALKELMAVKVQHKDIEPLGILEGESGEVKPEGAQKNEQ